MIVSNPCISTGMCGGLRSGSQGFKLSLARLSRDPGAVRGSGAQQRKRPFVSARSIGWGSEGVVAKRLDGSCLVLDRWRDGRSLWWNGIIAVGENSESCNLQYCKLRRPQTQHRKQRKANNKQRERREVQPAENEKSIPPTHCQTIISTSLGSLECTSV